MSTNAPARRTPPAKRPSNQDGRRYQVQPQSNDGVVWEVVDTREGAVLFTANERLCKAHASGLIQHEARIRRRR